MNIYVDEAGITSVSNKIKNEIDNMINKIKNLDNVIENINEVWQGNDALKYINKMREKYLVALDELSDLLEDYQKFLSNIPGAYSTLDEAFKAKNLDV